MRCYSAFFHFTFLVRDLSSDLVRSEEETVNDQQTLSSVASKPANGGKNSHEEESATISYHLSSCITGNG